MASMPEERIPSATEPDLRADPDETISEDVEPEKSQSPPMVRASSPDPLLLPPSAQKSYDYLLKVLLVGDSDVGKQEILSDLEDGNQESPYCSSEGAGE